MLKYDPWIKNDSEFGPNPSEKSEIFSRIKKGVSNLKNAHEKGELGYLKLPTSSISSILDFSASLPDSIKTILVLGIGGSSLGPRAVFDAWGGKATRELIFSENVDAASFSKLLVDLVPSETLVCVTTKSGSTIETMSKFWFLFEHFKNELSGPVEAHFVAITDPNKGPLRSMVEELGIKSFAVAPEVGGRFSVMTPVGIAPLAFVGFPVERILAGAQKVVLSVDQASEGETDGALVRAIFDHYWAYHEGFDTTVMMPYVDTLAGFSEWFCQLWGESLAKDEDLSGKPSDVSLTPTRALGTIDQHSQLQLFVSGRKTKHVVLVESSEAFDIKVPIQSGLPESLVHLGGRSFSEILEAEARGTQAALERAGVPLSRWVLAKNDPESVGAMMMIYMVVTSVMGDLLGINPYDQPGVELGKRVAHGLLGKDACLDDAKLAEKITPEFAHL